MADGSFVIVVDTPQNIEIIRNKQRPVFDVHIFLSFVSVSEITCIVPYY